MSIKACIFDLDGVLVDTAKYHFLAWNRLAKKLNIVFTENDNERLKGVSRMDSLDIILEIGNIQLSNSLRLKYASLKNKWYKEFINKMTSDEILPGCVEFITELKHAGINVAIGSASKNTPVILRRVGLNKMFDVVVDGNIVTSAKPDPEVFIKAAELLEAKPADCVVFEDAAAGVKAALNAGMICVGVGSKKVLKGAHLVIPGIDKMSLNKLAELGKEVRI